MSIFKLTGDLAGKTVYYNKIAINKISVPDNFSGKIPHPMPGKKFLNEEDFASIICEVLPGRGGKIRPAESTDSEDYGLIDSYSETFEYHSKTGMIRFSIIVRNGMVEIESVTYGGITITGEV